MSERKLTGLECKKVEQTDTKTDKEESTKYTYQFHDEDKNYVVTLKTTEKMDYEIGQDIGVTINRDQVSMDAFTEEETEEPESSIIPDSDTIYCHGCGIANPDENHNCPTPKFKDKQLDTLAPAPDSSKSLSEAGKEEAKALEEKLNEVKEEEPDWEELAKNAECAECGGEPEYFEHDEETKDTKWWCTDCMDPDKICGTSIDEESLKEFWEDDFGDMPDNQTVTCMSPKHPQTEMHVAILLDRPGKPSFHWRTEEPLPPEDPETSEPTEEPPMYPEPEVTEEEKENDQQETPYGEVFENPGCVDYADGDPGNPGMCACSGRTNPFCEGENCIDIRSEETPPFVPEGFKIELEEGSISMSILQGIEKGETNEELLKQFIKTYSEFGSDEFESVLDLLDSQGFTVPDEEAEPTLTDKGRDRLGLVNMPPEGFKTCPDCNKPFNPLMHHQCSECHGILPPWTCFYCGKNYKEDGAAGNKDGHPACVKCMTEEKGSPETPSKEKELPPIEERPLIQLTVPTKQPAKGKIICGICKKERVKGGDVGEQEVCKRCFKEQTELHETAQAIQEEQVAELHKETPLEETLDALTNGKLVETPDNAHKVLPPTETEPEKPRKRVRTLAKIDKEVRDKETEEELAEEKAKTEAFKKDLEETATREAAGEPSTLLCKKTDFPTDQLGGLRDDITIEKNKTDNFLYAHAKSMTPPINGVQIQKFCQTLKLKTGIDWKHIMGNAFSADQETLNKVRGEPELIE